MSIPEGVRFPRFNFLALSLPKENLEHHYRLTWTGFDLILVLAIYLTAHMAFRLDARVVFPATVVATLLVADAWFDVTTSTTAADATQALILALLVELPAAAFSLYVAHRVGRRVRKLVHPDHVTDPHPPVPHRTQGHSALPAEPSSPVELPPERERGRGNPAPSRDWARLPMRARDGRLGVVVPSQTCQPQTSDS